MSRPPKLDLRAQTYIRRWAKKWRSIPTRKEVAAMFNISEATVDRFAKGYEYKPRHDIEAIAREFCEQSHQYPVTRETDKSEQNSIR